MKKLFLSLIFGIFLISSVLAVSSVSAPSACCEKTLAGGICINDDQTQCDSAFKFAPTSCESTSFCKIGTCYDSKEGICTEHVPQSVCQNNNGTWSDKDASQLSQCQLGCCVISDQASFVSLVRCKRLSTSFGITMDFRSSITSETDCIAVANEQDTGACVYSVNGDRTCKFTTRADCGVPESVIAINSSQNDTTAKQFYKDILCSAEELSITCARQVTTGCYKGDVYWFDSCGNRENVYSSNKDVSWNKGRVATPEAVCAATSGSRDCGNCDYLLGSVCSQWTGFLGLGKPTFGNFFCKQTTCTDRDGNKRMNGESWCVYDSPMGNGRDPAGSRQYREICVNGAVQVEPCADYRNEICIHSGIATSQGEFSTSACRVNRWQDCTAQTNKRTCENTDQRDCLWVEKIQGVDFNSNQSSTTGVSQPFSNPVSSVSSSSSAASQLTSGATAASSLSSTVGSFTNAGTTGQAIFPITGDVINHVVGSGVGQWEQAPTTDSLRTNRTDNESGLCVPAISPGFQFWTQGDAQTICAQASATCQVNVTAKTSKDILTGKSKTTYTMENNECLQPIKGQTNKYEVKSDWAVKADAICSALGDCGADININGRFTDDGYVWKYDNQSYFFTQAEVGPIASSTLQPGQGEAVAVDYVINNNLKLNSDDYVYIKA